MMGTGTGGKQSDKDNTAATGTNYYNAIFTNPDYQTMSGLLSAQSAADAAQRAAQTQRLLIQLGEVPSSSFVTGPYASYFGQDVNDLTRSLASQNTQSGLSILARLSKQYEDARLRNFNDLAARGMLQSGETGYQLGELGQARLQSEYDARMSVLDQLNNLYSQFASAERQRQTQAALSMMDAAQAESQYPWNYPTGSQYDYGNYYGDPAIGPNSPGGAPSQNYATPSQQEIAQMAKWVKYAKDQRPPEIINLFQKYSTWRGLTPDWWK